MNDATARTGSAGGARLRLAAISGDDAHHRFLVSVLLAAGFDVVLWLVEPAAAQRRRALAQRRWIDWLAAVYHLRRRQLLGLERYRRRAFALSEPMPPVRREEVGYVSDARAHELLEEAAPDATILIGCGILKPSMLALAGSPVLNVHGGHLPEYRGNHCIFFALDNEDYEHVGATIHFVDAGIDTGDLVEVVRTRSAAGELAEHVYCRADRLAIERLVTWLHALEAGEPLPRRPQPAGGRTYRTRDRTPYHDVRHWLRRRRRRRAATASGSVGSGG